MDTDSSNVFRGVIRNTTSDTQSENLKEFRRSDFISVLPLRMIVCGRPDEGKSVTVKSFLFDDKSKGAFDYSQLWWFTSNPSQTSLQSTEALPYSELKPFSEWEKRVGKEKEIRMKDIHRVFVFDDLPENTGVWSEVYNYFKLGRQLNFTCIMIVQDCRSRNNVYYSQIKSTCFIFMVGNTYNAKEKSEFLFGVGSRPPYGSDVLNNSELDFIAYNVKNASILKLYREDRKTLDDDESFMPPKKKKKK